MARQFVVDDRNAASDHSRSTPLHRGATNNDRRPLGCFCLWRPSEGWTSCSDQMVNKHTLIK